MEFFCLTPLPGSEDHKVLDVKGVWMDPDMNIYDTEHVTTHHAIMPDEEFQITQEEACIDIALTPATDDDFDELEMFSSDAAHTAVDKALRKSAKTVAAVAAE
jgi:hypothetical protein